MSRCGGNKCRVRQRLDGILDGEFRQRERLEGHGFGTEAASGRLDPSCTLRRSTPSPKDDSTDPRDLDDAIQRVHHVIVAVLASLYLHQVVGFHDEHEDVSVEGNEVPRRDLGVCLGWTTRDKHINRLMKGTCLQPQTTN